MVEPEREPEHRPEPALPDESLPAEALRWSPPVTAPPSSPAAELDPLDRDMAAQPSALASNPRSTGVQLMVLAWCLWLLGSWAAARWAEPPTRLERWMLLASLIGLIVVWPTARLSQERWPPGRLARRAGERAASLRRRWRLMELGTEWLCLVLVFQAVLWPISFVARWTLVQTLWLNAAVLAWSAAAAALVGWASLFAGPVGRSVVVAVCVLLLVGEPTLVAVLPALQGQLGVSPLHAVWGLSEPAVRLSLDPWRAHVTGMAAAAALAWGVLAIAARRARHGFETEPPG